MTFPADVTFELLMVAVIDSPPSPPTALLATAAPMARSPAGCPPWWPVESDREPGRVGGEV